MYADHNTNKGNRTTKVLILLGLLAGMTAGGFYYFRQKEQPHEHEELRSSVPLAESLQKPTPTEHSETPSNPETDEQSPPQTPPATEIATPSSTQKPEPNSLPKRIQEALNRGDLKELSKLLQTPNMDSSASELLQKIADSGTQGGWTIRKVGEVVLGEVERYAIEHPTTPGKLLIDIRIKNGALSDTLTVRATDTQGQPSQEHQTADCLQVGDAFLQALLSQNFPEARSHLEKDKVSDVTLAGLCIIFEEGQYKLRKDAPVRTLYTRDSKAGLVANVIDANNEQRAQFGLTLNKNPDAGRWLIDGLNMDRLLSDYVARVSGGDANYTPLIQNPEDGDTLVVYFGFDEARLSERTQKQLDIVARILRERSGRSVTISGHTDDLGTPDYNQKLSLTRAKATKTYLTEVGIPESQIIMQALGESAPRAANRTSKGDDNPQGRRANRRAEILLAF